jgi:hypothetical protein
MKHIAEQFTFGFDKDFYVGDIVVVTPDSDDVFDGFMGKVVEIKEKLDMGKFLIVEREKTLVKFQLRPRQCRLAKDLDFL